MLYALPAAERERLEALFGPKSEGSSESARFSLDRFGGVKDSAVHRLMSALVGKLESGCESSGEWRQARFEGPAVGVDPVALEGKPECFFYLPELGAGLVPGAQGEPEPTNFVSCRVVPVTRKEQLPEDLSSDLEAFMAMMEGRLRLLVQPRPGRALLPNGERLELGALAEAGGRYLAPMEGVGCSPEAAKAVNSALRQMGFAESGKPWPSVREVATAAYRWDADRGMDRATYWEEEGPGERYYCSVMSEGSVEGRSPGLVTRHAERAIEWAERLAGKDADIRLGSSGGPRLLERCWRARGEMGKGALTLPPNKMSARERELKMPEPAEARVSPGVSPDFEAAWGRWVVKKAQEPEAAGPANVKRRAMAPGGGAV